MTLHYFYPVNPKVRIKMVGIVNKAYLLPMAKPGPLGWLY